VLQQASVALLALPAAHLIRSIGLPRRLFCFRNSLVVSSANRTPQHLSFAGYLVPHKSLL
jgi:hypothetical protein